MEGINEIGKIEKLSTSEQGYIIKLMERTGKKIPKEPKEPKNKTMKNMRAYLKKHNRYINKLRKIAENEKNYQALHSKISEAVGDIDRIKKGRVHRKKRGIKKIFRLAEIENIKGRKKKSIGTNKKEKDFLLIYEDRQGNELQTINITAKNLKEAKKQRDRAFSNTRLNDLYKIKIRAV